MCQRMICKIMRYKNILVTHSFSSLYSYSSRNWPHSLHTLSPSPSLVCWAAHGCGKTWGHVILQLLSPCSFISVSVSVSPYQQTPNLLFAEDCWENRDDICHSPASGQSDIRPWISARSLHCGASEWRRGGRVHLHLPGLQKEATG